MSETHKAYARLEAAAFTASNLAQATKAVFEELAAELGSALARQAAEGLHDGTYMQIFHDAQAAARAQGIIDENMIVRVGIAVVLSRQTTEVAGYMQDRASKAVQDSLAATAFRDGVEAAKRAFNEELDEITGSPPST